MNMKAFKFILENEPVHFYNTWNREIPTTVKIMWLKKFIKKNISKEDFINFIESSGHYFTNINDYKQSDHFLILKNCLEIDLEEYNWLHNNKLYNEKAFDRHFKIWQLNRSI